MTPDEFISTIAPHAVEDAMRSGVLPSLTLAQAILESAWGRSRLAIEGKNLFGIKGKGGSYPTKEFRGGVERTEVHSFRHYSSWLGSIADHSDLFLRLPRYKALIGETDYKKACRAVQAAGYATDPKYADKLIRLIEQYNLHQYDRRVRRMSKEDAEAVIKSLQRLWAIAESDADRAEIHRQANTVRKAAGML